MALVETTIGRLQNARNGAAKKIDYLRGYSLEEKNRVKKILKGSISEEDVKSYRNEKFFSTLMPWKNLLDISMYRSLLINSDTFVKQKEKEMEKEDERWGKLKPEERTAEMQTYYFKKSKRMGIKPDA